MRRAAMLGLGVLALASPPTGRPVLLWNASPSVPVGLYRVMARTPVSGELAAIRLPEPIRRLAVERAYLGARALLIKPVTAGPGDVVCRQEEAVTINGHLVGRARTVDATGRVLPQWRGCVTLAANQVFVLTEMPDSFDSRYFGPVDHSNVIGAARLIWAAP